LILSGTLQVLLNSLVFDMSADDAVAALRIHHQWMPPVLMLEAGIPEITRKALEKDGHQTRPLNSMGAVQLVQRRNNHIEGAADPRKGGGAAGW
jgi:gamma-glutamyltranspeptidase/glutathione hydrolase